MTDTLMTAEHGSARAIRARVSALLGRGEDETINGRLFTLADRIVQATAGEPDVELDKHLEEDLSHRVAGGSEERWRYDIRAERLECLLNEGHRIVDDMREAHRVSLPDEAPRAEDDILAGVDVERIAAMGYELEDIMPALTVRRRLTRLLKP